MSAYIVNYHHINALINWARSNDVAVVLPDSHRTVKGNENEIGNILWRENYRSINSRYSEDSTPENYEFKLSLKVFKPVEILKACDGFDYQACETEDYFSTEAAEIIQTIRKYAIHRLPGYDNADWEIRESLPPGQGEVIELSSLFRKPACP